MTNAERFYRAIMAYLTWAISNCKCGGSGKVEGICGEECTHYGGIICRTCYAPSSCPTCTPLQACRDTLCWHEPGKQDKQSFERWWTTCKHCGFEVFHANFHNPTFTNPTDIRAMLERAGLWERFVVWHKNQCMLYQEDIFIFAWITYAAILTDPNLFLQASTSFVEEVTG